MPSFAAGLIAWTACAMTCAAECRRIASPSGDPIRTGSATSPAWSSLARSRSSPPTRTATTDLSVKISKPVVVSDTSTGCRSVEAGAAGTV